MRDLAYAPQGVLTVSASIRLKQYAKNTLEFGWKRRHVIVKSVRGVGKCGLWVYHRLPIPRKIRFIIKDIFFLSLEHFVLHTHAYHAWLRQRKGTGRISALFAPDALASARKAPSPSAPSQPMWDALIAAGRGRNATASADATVDVVLPVYRGYDETLNCIYTALNTPNRTHFELVVINDCTPEPALADKLIELRDQNLITLLINQENLGFVATVNKGMQLHPHRDIILLNADTEVYNDWVDRLVAASTQAERIGSVTPFSNNAEICSYPYFAQDNVMPLEIPYEQLDALASQANEEQFCELPTAVGFCMFISRACLDDVGYFDVETFGKGYGEENDFCLRAIAKGWKHILAGNIFVRHLGGTSFAGEKKKRVMAAMKILNQRYPHYHASVAQFLAQDPARIMRTRLDIARLDCKSGISNFLMVNHHLGGGTQRNVIEMIDELWKDSVGAFILEPLPSSGARGLGEMKLSHHLIEHTPNLVFSMEYDRDHIAETLLRLEIAHVHIHHVIGYEHRILDFLTELTHELELRYDVTIHDYYSICPRINLVNGNSSYCGEPSITECERCIETNHSHAGALPVWQWRLQFSRFLGAARMVICPSGDVLERMQRYYPNAPLTLRWHAESFDQHDTCTMPVVAPQQDLVIAAIGAISDIKGSHVLVALAKDATKRKLPIRFVIIGHSSHHEINAGLDRITVTGAYKEEEIGTLLHTHQPHLAFIPSVWPETYCYTLSIAWRYGILPLAFDIGAPAERIHACGRGFVIPFELKDDASALNDYFMTLRSKGWDNHMGDIPENVAYPNILKDYYGFTIDENTPFLQDFSDEDEEV